MKTKEKDYTERLQALGSGWKRLLDVQLPYRLHLKRLRLGFVLDIGCGIGRNLLNLDGRGVGVDHNPHSVEVALSRGLAAYTPDDFLASAYARQGRFDALLLSHVLEHMGRGDAVALIREYLSYLRKGGRAVLITPQECGFRSDPSHVEFTDLAALAAIAAEAGLAVEKSYSFPFPRFVGRIFRHNEFVVIARKP